MSAAEVPDGAGDCFRAAVTAMEALAGEGAEVLLAHGEPVYRGTEPVDGDRFAHAWAEVKVPGQGWYCIDISNGLRAGIKRTVYYRAGSIDPEAVQRYTPREAWAKMTETGHYGPWHTAGWAAL